MEENCSNLTDPPVLVLHIHDELIYEVALRDLQKTSKLLKDSMEGCFKLCVPLRVKVKAGNSWGELNELKF